MVVLAADASENARARAEGFLNGRRALLVPLPYTKSELSAMLGKSGCSMAACTDFGLSAAFLARCRRTARTDATRSWRRRCAAAPTRRRGAEMRKGNRGGNTMSSFDKYRVHEVAKDFGMTSKAITEILTKYATTPKNHMQVLEDGELSVIFEYLTQHNQCATMEDLFRVPEKAAEPKQAGHEQARSAKEESVAPQPARPAAESAPKAAAAETAAPEAGKAAAQAPAQQQSPKPRENKPHQPRQVPEKRVIDTRGGGNVNLGKYDERFDRLAAGAHGVPEGGKRGGDRGGKEKFQNRQKAAPAAGHRQHQEAAGRARPHAEAAL